VHGLGGALNTWIYNLPALAATHRVVAVDLPGFGASDHPRTPMSIDDHAELLAAFSERLALGLPVVVGHSMGGMITTALAARHPQSVSGLVLVSGGALRVSSMRLAMISALFGAFRGAGHATGAPRLLVRSRTLRNVLLRPVFHDPGALAVWLVSELVPAVPPAGVADALRAVARADVASHLVRCPVLIVWGAEDRLVPVSYAKQLAATFADAALTVLPAVGHCAMLERPHAFNELLAEFVSRRQAPVRHDPGQPSAELDQGGLTDPESEARRQHPR
jgi:pimeloyl-ACP methyl ester carboxylesterase